MLLHELTKLAEFFRLPGNLKLPTRRNDPLRPCISQERRDGQVELGKNRRYPGFSTQDSAGVRRDGLQNFNGVAYDEASAELTSSIAAVCSRAASNARGGGAPSGSSAVKIHVPDDGPNGRRMPTSSKRLWTHSPSQPHECRPSSLRPRRETAEGHPRSNSSRFSNHIFKIQEETYHRTTRIMPSIPLIGSSSRSKVGP